MIIRIIDIKYSLIFRIGHRFSHYTSTTSKIATDAFGY